MSGTLGYLALTVENGGENGNDTVKDIGVDESIAEIHRYGITGENVSVGVLDVNEFDTDHPMVAPRLVERRQFINGTLASADNTKHGTATAVTVARVASNADLYLGSFETAADYEAALEWLMVQDVDVIVAPVADAGTFGDGSSQLEEATTEAIERGVVVVAPTGNLGTRHWFGEYTPTADQAHIFEKTPVNEVGAEPGRAEYWLTWDDPSVSYELELHRIRAGNETELLAQGVPNDHRTVPNKRLRVRLGEGRFALVVRGPPEPTSTRIRVLSPTHDLSIHTPERSVTAPATASGAIAVGAFDPATRGVEPYSSRGPTVDGRLGVYVVAPSTQSVPGIGQFEGTSASAAFVGGWPPS